MLCLQQCIDMCGLTIHQVAEIRPNADLQEILLIQSTLGQSFPPAFNSAEESTPKNIEVR